MGTFRSRPFAPICIFLSVGHGQIGCIKFQIFSFPPPPASGSYWAVYKFFASQSLHNRKILKKKIGEANDEANFSFFILLQRV
jgi:hypothetical protein